MKKSILICMIAVAGTLPGQPYGMRSYVNTGGPYTMSDGFYVQNSPGFLMTGFTPVAAANSGNFVVYKTAPGGVFPATGAWVGEYGFSWNGPNCTGAMTQVTNCSGLSIVEASCTTNKYYAVMTNDDGLFMTTINNGSNLGTIKKYYPFPTGSTNATKPIIVESAQNHCEFYITGSYENNSTIYMYLIQIDMFGVVVQSKLFDVGTTPKRIIPNAMILSPFNTSVDELVIVGEYEDVTALQKQGFILMYNASTSNINLFEEYGTGQQEDDYFTSICVSNAGGSGNQGFIIGGYSEITGGVDCAWVLKIDATGTALWNQIYSYTYASGKGVISVTERPNSYSSGYDLFAMSGDVGANFNLIKIDPSSTPSLFSQTGNTNNGAWYYDSGSSSRPEKLSYLSAGPNDVGLHCYGNDSNGDFYLITSYFNLETSCSTTQTLYSLSYSPANGPNGAAVSSINQGTGPSDCVVNVTSYMTNMNVALTCTNNTSGSGNNSKVANVEYQNLNETVIFPNPANKTIIIKGISNAGIRLFDLVGNCLLNEDISADEEQHEVNAEKLNLPEGFYILQIIKNGQKIDKKVSIVR